MIPTVAFVIVTIVLVGSASCHNLVSPCPDIFKYDPNVEEELARHWYGVINLQTNEPLYGLYVDILLTNKADSLNVRNWTVMTNDNTAFSIQDAKFKLETGERLQIIFYTQYRDTRKVPALHVIRFNGREICSHGGLTDIIPPLPGFEVECGIHGREQVTNHLIVAGGKTLPGEWPWLVALFHSTEDGNLAFRCGGSLLENRFVITAAHCLYNPNTKKQMEIKNVIIIVGARDILRETYEGNNTRGLAAMYIHTEYDTKTNDIALLVLNEPVTYSKFVKPICLWVGDDDQVDLVNAGQNGTVVGWGQTGNGLSLEEPLSINVPIISLINCRGSHRLFHDLTNDKSLCTAAANRGPCNGDSGSGLYIEQNGHWRLRGVVSSSLISSSGSILCNLTLPIIYADVAKYRNWISDTIYYEPEPKTPIPTNPSLSSIKPRKNVWTKLCSARNAAHGPITRAQRINEESELCFASIYHKDHEGTSSSTHQKCGGSLISDSHVLTAAHCLIDKSTGKPIEIRLIHIYLQTYNFFLYHGIWNIGIRLVDKLVIHQDYNTQTQDNNIALLRLSIPVLLTPMCLWPEDKVDLENITSKFGLVLGFDYEAKRSEVLVVQQEKCHLPNAIHQRHTNNFKWCAGILEGKVCYNALGGGVLFKLPTSAGREEWFLRGVLSINPLPGTPHSCDLPRYVNFTDVAKYLDWIEDIVYRDIVSRDTISQDIIYFT